MTKRVSHIYEFSASLFIRFRRRAQWSRLQQKLKNSPEAKPHWQSQIYRKFHSRHCWSVVDLLAKHKSIVKYISSAEALFKRVWPPCLSANESCLSLGDLTSDLCGGKFNLSGLIAAHNTCWRQHKMITTNSKSVSGLVLFFSISIFLHPVIFHCG